MVGISVGYFGYLASGPRGMISGVLLSVFGFFAREGQKWALVALGVLYVTLAFLLLRPLFL